MKGRVELELELELERDASKKANKVLRSET